MVDTTLFMGACFVSRMKPSRILAVAAFAVALAGAARSSGAPFVLLSEVPRGTIAVIDTSSNTVVTRVPVAASDLLGVAVSPDGASIWVGGFTGTVWVIDPGTGSVSHAIPVGSGPRAFAFTRDGARVYVVDQFADAIWVIDAASKTVIDSTTLPEIGSPHGYVWIAIAPDDSRIYVADTLGNLLIVDPIAHAVIATVKAGDNATQVSISNDGALAYVATETEKGIVVVDTSTAAVIDTIAIGPVRALQITPDGLLAYASREHTVSVIDLPTRQVLGVPIPMGNFPTGIVFTPDQQFAYVAHSNCRGGCTSSSDYYGSVSVIDTATKAVVATIDVPEVAPSWLALIHTFTVVPPPMCADGVDNDADGGADWSEDPGCDSPSDQSERSAALVCDDGVDNDGDGLTDFPADPGCISPIATLEDPACDDGVDNDGDGLTDFPDDPGCDASTDDSEKLSFLAKPGSCDDDIDDDFDGLTDYPADPDCHSPADLEVSDVDGDGVPPLNDNCVIVANPDQQDSDFDGFGNACDADLDNDGVVGISDFNLLRSSYGSVAGSLNFNPALDINGDGAIGIVDLARLLRAYRKPPGPSGLPCAVSGYSCYCTLQSCGG